MLNHNKQLKNIIKTAQLDVELAKNDDDLLETIKRMARFGKQLAFDHSIHYLVMAVFALFAGVYGWFCYTDDSPLSFNNIVMLIAMLSPALFAFDNMAKNDRSISELSDTIYNRSLLFDNNLEVVSINGVEFAKKLARAFYELQRGNHHREIKQLIKGVHKSDNGEMLYHLFHFHYVNKEKVKASNGNDITYEYTKHDRYGVIVDVKAIKNILVMSKNKRISVNHNATYQPASIQFNKQFIVKGDNELMLSKFLKPTVVLEVEKIANTFDKINYEFNSAGHLCISFEDKDLFEITRTYGLDAPLDFLKEIRKVIVLPKLKALLSHIEKLMRYNDVTF